MVSPVTCSYFASGLDAFPHTQVADDPAQQQTQRHLPVYGSWFLQTIRDLEDSVPESGKIIFSGKLWNLHLASSDNSSYIL